MQDLVALLFGAVIILVFSYERFNRATYEGGRHLERVINMLSPDKLRGRRIVLNAYGFYAFALMLIYLFLCAYAEVLPLLGGPDLASNSVGASELPSSPDGGAAYTTTGFIPGNGSELPWEQPLSSAAEPAGAQSIFDVGIDASVSLAMALIIVGLAPTFPVLRRFEDWMRSAAHRIADIPTRVIGASEDLRHNDLLIVEDTSGFVPVDTLLIPRGDWERMAHYPAAANDQLTAPEDFRRDIQLIFATSAWILDRKLKIASTISRGRFDELEKELIKRKDALILELDDKSNYRPGELHPADAERGSLSQGKETEEPSELKRASWERLARDVDDLADDLCILLVLYVEHGIILTEQSTMASESPSRGSARQQYIAREKLEAFLSDILGDHSTTTNQLRSHVVLVWLWTLGVVVFVALLWSLFPGRFETEMQRGMTGNPYLRALNYIFTAFNAYSIPLLIALALHDGGLYAKRWRNMWRARWTVWLPQAVFVVFVAWAVATFFFVALALWQAAFAEGGFDANERDVWSTLRLSFEYNAPTPLRGAVLALFLVVLIDAWLVRPWAQPRESTLLSSLSWAASASVIMALCGGLTRTLSSWTSALYASRPEFDEIDRGLILYAAVYSAIIGFCVVFCVAEALRNYRRPLRRSRSGNVHESNGPSSPAPAE